MEITNEKICTCGLKFTSKNSRAVLCDICFVKYKKVCCNTLCGRTFASVDGKNNCKKCPEHQCSKCNKAFFGFIDKKIKNPLCSNCYKSPKKNDGELKTQILLLKMLIGQTDPNIKSILSDTFQKILVLGNLEKSSPKKKFRRPKKSDLPQEEILDSDD